MSENIDQPEPVLRSSTGYLALIRGNPNFRRLWFGQIVSLFGDWFNLIASAALISSLTQSGLAVGGLFVVRMLAPFLISPLAGVVADRYNRKMILITADILRGLIVLGFLLVRESQQVWLLYSLTAVQLGLSGFFFPARNAILPDIVSRRDLGTANALSASTWSVMLAVGAALGGLVTGGWGIPPSFVIDALTFFLSAVFIFQVQYQYEQTESEATVKAVLKEYLDGLRYLVQHRDVLVVAMLKGAQSLFVGGAFQVVNVALAEQKYPLGEGSGISLGLLYTASGIGTGIGPILARRLTGDNERLMRLTIIGAYGLSFLGLLTVSPLFGFPVVLLGVFIQAFGGGINWVFSTQLLLQILPDRVRGRVFSTEFAMFTLSNAIGAAVGGWAIDNTELGISGMVLVMAGLVLVPGILWALWSIRQVQKGDSSGETVKL